MASSRPRDDKEVERNVIIEQEDVVLMPPELSLHAGSGLIESPSSSSMTCDSPIEYQAAKWIEAVTGVTFSRYTSQMFARNLKDGVLLCELVNKISPGLIPQVHHSPVGYKMMENIGQFLKAAQRLGVSRCALFNVEDLFEMKCPVAVASCIMALGMVVPSACPQFTGPHLLPETPSRATRQPLLCIFSPPALIGKKQQQQQNKEKEIHHHGQNDNHHHADSAVQRESITSHVDDSLSNGEGQHECTNETASQSVPQPVSQSANQTVSQSVTQSDDQGSSVVVEPAGKHKREHETADEREEGVHDGNDEDGDGDQHGESGGGGGGGGGGDGKEDRRVKTPTLDMEAISAEMPDRFHKMDPVKHMSARARALLPEEVIQSPRALAMDADPIRHPPRTPDLQSNSTPGSKDLGRGAWSYCNYMDAVCHSLSPLGRSSAGFGHAPSRAEILVRQWIEAVTSEKLAGVFLQWLQNGVVLCKLVNAISPGIVPETTLTPPTAETLSSSGGGGGSSNRDRDSSGCSYGETIEEELRRIEDLMEKNIRENMLAFFQACRQLGVTEAAIFDPTDLISGDGSRPEKTTSDVIQCVLALAMTVEATRLPVYTGPRLKDFQITSRIDHQRSMSLGGGGGGGDSSHHHGVSGGDGGASRSRGGGGGGGGHYGTRGGGGRSALDRAKGAASLSSTC